MYFFQDGEHCLDRLYGGYFPDWSCGGQWNNMMAFLTTLFTNCHQANVHLAVFLNGSLEASRFKDWVKNQMAIKSNVNHAYSGRGDLTNIIEMVCALSHCACIADNPGRGL